VKNSRFFSISFVFDKYGYAEDNQVALHLIIESSMMSNLNTTGNDLEGRLISYGVHTITISNIIRRNYVRSHLRYHLIRSGTSPA
jgi:hypothetical protein